MGAAMNAMSDPSVQYLQTTLDDFRLADGEVVRLKLAFTQTGPRHAPAYLLLHGYAGSHYALEAHPDAADSGWASAWVGPGKLLDTRHVQVITVNLPGSSYGSQWSHASGAVDGHASVSGMARAVDALLEQLDIDCLQGVIGYSFGGYVALQLKADHPQRVQHVLALCTALKGRGKEDELPALRALSTPQLRADFRVQVLNRSGLQEWAMQQGPAALQAEIDRVQQWSTEFSAESLARLRAAAIGFDVGACPPQVRMLYASSDMLFPPPTPLPRHAKVVPTPFGHQSLVYDPEAWLVPIGEWLRAH